MFFLHKDLLGDSLNHHDGVPKVILHGHSDTGFDVINMLKNLDPNDDQLRQTGGIVHCKFFFAVITPHSHFPTLLIFSMFTRLFI